jgi:hypothetical protein
MTYSRAGISAHKSMDGQKDFFRDCATGYIWRQSLRSSQLAHKSMDGAERFFFGIALQDTFGVNRYGQVNGALSLSVVISFNDDEYEEDELFCDPTPKEYYFEWKRCVDVLLETPDWKEEWITRMSPFWTEEDRLRFDAQCRMLRHEQVVAYARAEVDFARVGGGWPLDLQRDFEDTLTSDEIEVLRQERLQYGGIEFEDDEWNVLNRVERT